MDGFSEFGINIVIYAYYQPADFWGFRELVHKASLQIKRRYEAEEIQFVFQHPIAASGSRELLLGQEASTYGYSNRPLTY